METLRKITLAVLFAMLFANIGIAQNYKALQDAFSASYKHETSAEYSKAVDDLKKLYEENKNSYEVNLRLGWLYYMSGQFTTSCTYYQKAMQLMPMSIEAKLGFVSPAAALGNWDQVKTQYLDIIKIDDKHYTANYRMGMILYGKQKYTEAFKYFEKIANLYPFDYDAIHMYAWEHYRLQKTREAKVLFNKVLMIKPGDTSALEGLSLIK